MDRRHTPDTFETTAFWGQVGCVALATITVVLTAVALS